VQVVKNFDRYSIWFVRALAVVVVIVAIVVLASCGAEPTTCMRP
jgi:hypothetical protein